MPDGPRLLADRCRLDAMLGSGGMGQVWQGRDETLGREVAVKEVRLARELTDEQRDALCQRMLREARTSVSRSASPTRGRCCGGRPPMPQRRLGFQVAVPTGWERSLDGPTRVDFVSPDGSTFLRVDKVEQAGPSAERAWLTQEQSVSQSLPGYERIRIEPVDYRSWDTADWEFTWEGDNGPVHVLNRGIATDTRGFALYVSAPASVWESDGLPLFETVTENFQAVD